MKPDGSITGRFLVTSLAMSTLGGCEVIRDIAEFCSQETLAVTTTADLRRPCDEVDCPLWGAIAAANTCNSGMTVTIPEGSRFLLGVPPPDAGSTPAQTIFPAITGRLSIQGNGSELARLRTSGVPPDRFFVIRPSGDLTIANFSLQGGGGDGLDGPVSGGAFVNHGTLTLENVDLVGNTARINGGAIDNQEQLVIRAGQYRDNRAGGCDEHGGGAIHNAEGAVTRIETAEFSSNQGCGGAIHNAGQLDVVNSTFADNRGGDGEDNTYNHGGALMNEPEGAPAVATIVGSTFSGNRAMVGAAIVNSGDSRLTVHSSTFSGNVAHLPCPDCLPEDRPSSPSGRVIASHRGPVELADVTIVGNICEDDLPECAGGISISGDRGRISVSNSIIADNSGGNCVRVPGVTELALVVTGANLDSDGSCPGFTVHGSPLLGPLADNGGPTRTRALLPGSPALDAGTDCLAQDQRGESRARSAEDPCDLGAFEAQR